MYCINVHVNTHVQIVDSVIALFRVDFTGRGELADRQVYFRFVEIATLSLEYVISLFIYPKVNNLLLQQKLGQMLSRLTKIAEEFNVAVYMTNQGNSYYHGIFDLAVCSFIQKLFTLKFGIYSVFNFISWLSIPNVFLTTLSAVLELN